ncbi:MAG TPA: hypothetical protein VGH54_21655 [Mycobacterium sp.]|jgi:hypothetical protein|uniref:hypothetical protein n=1 Tax=Mycobacterium sp. TaxID=1785 RepID=UPI002F3EDC93
MGRLLLATAAGAVAATVWAERRPWGLAYYRRAYHRLALSTGQAKACSWAKKAQGHRADIRPEKSPRP